MGFTKKITALLCAFALLFAATFAGGASSSQALSSADWQAGNIIADGVFYDGFDMSLYDIENFLKSKVPVCDTMGTQQHSSGMTRAEYGASRGYHAPYICLKDYRQDTHERQAEPGLCTGLGAGNKSAAQIIYEVAMSCGINPKVLIVLLQKEQSLVTDDWPWSIQYQKATGYGCPDSAPCSELYLGFFNQVYMAARQYKRYVRDANIYNFRANTVSNIRYNANTNCGSGGVHLQNNGTAGLYNYTPYQPNQAALNNINGLGDGCSAYGNRNFWRLYHDWFGSTQVSGICTGTETPRPFVRRFYNHRTFQHFYSAYDCDIKFLERLGYINEGPYFNLSPPDADWATPVYRYYNPQTRLHIWSTTYETPEQLAAGGTGYRHEAGIVFYVARAGLPNVDTVYQFYNPQTYLHLLVPSPRPQDVQFLKDRAGYDQEGPAFYTQ